MRILFLSPKLPHAKVVSGWIIVHNRIRLLAERGYEVGLACFLSPADVPHVPELRPLLFELETIPVPPRPRYFQCLMGHFFSRTAFPFCSYRSETMRRLVGAMVERSRYDVVIAEFSGMGQFLYWNPYLPATRRVISCHSCFTAALQKAIDVRPWSLQAMQKRGLIGGVQRFEFAMYKSADLILALTPQERMTLLGYAPNLRIAVVPYGVDVEHFHPQPNRESEESIVFTGYYRDEANRDAVMWFCHTVWPRLKSRHSNLKFYVIGQNPTPDVRDLARKDPRIIVTGDVEDIAPYLARARLYVCPMRMGTGFRGKILQAMAAGVPVVSTSLAAEGIPSQNGENIALADTPHVLEESINLLLTDATMRKTISRKARDLVVQRFSWSRSVDLLDEALHEVVA